LLDLFRMFLFKSSFFKCGQERLSLGLLDWPPIISFQKGVFIIGRQGLSLINWYSHSLPLTKFGGVIKRTLLENKLKEKANGRT